MRTGANTKTGAFMQGAMTFRVRAQIIYDGNIQVSFPSTISPFRAIYMTQAQYDVFRFMLTEGVKAYQDGEVTIEFEEFLDNSEPTKTKT